MAQTEKALAHCLLSKSPHELKKTNVFEIVWGPAPTETYLRSQLLKQMKRSGASVHNLRMCILEPLLVPAHTLALKRIAGLAWTPMQLLGDCHSANASVICTEPCIT